MDLNKHYFTPLLTFEVGDVADDKLNHMCRGAKHTRKMAGAKICALQNWELGSDNQLFKRSYG